VVSSRTNSDDCWIDEPQLDVEPLARDRLVVACRPGHPLTRLKQISITQLLEFPIADLDAQEEAGAQRAAAARGTLRARADDYSGASSGDGTFLSAATSSATSASRA
jgi:DNA-binding transcriptional LysR family regulator